MGSCDESLTTSIMESLILCIRHDWQSATAIAATRGDEVAPPHAVARVSKRQDAKEEI
jgi:hypothetical protein